MPHNTKVVILRVILVNGLTCPFPGAGWIRLRGFAMALRNMGCEPIIVSGIGYKERFVPDWCDDDGIPIIRCIPQINLPHIICRVIDSIIAVFFLVLICLSFRPERIVVSLPPGNTLVGSAVAARLQRAQFVIDYRDEWELASKVSCVTLEVSTLLYSQADLVSTDNEAHQMSLSKRGIESCLIPNGADLDELIVYPKTQARNEFGIPLDSIVIGFTGIVGAYYDLKPILLAIAHNNATRKRKPFMLAIAGFGEAASNLAMTAIRLGIDERVLHVGTIVDRDRLARFLSACDFGVIPYDKNPLWRNTIPAKFFEYLACGLSVFALCYNNSLLSQKIESLNVGISAEWGSTDDIAGSLRTFIDRFISQDASNHSRTVAVKLFDRRKSSERFAKIVSALPKRREANHTILK